MELELDGWKFIRQAGIGEIQHVRTRLLGVACFHHVDLVEQIKGALQAGTELGMLTRIHLNRSRLSEDELNGVLDLFSSLFAFQQLELWSDMDEPAFRKKIGERVEIFITPPPHATNSAALVKNGVLQVWERSGGRFLQGNFASHSVQRLKELLPDMFPELHEQYLAFKGQQQ
jgi:hypothetical protein